MAVATYQKFNAFVENVFEKVHNCGSDSWKLFLSATAPIAANSVKADLVEITPGNGYPTGGLTLVTSSSAQSGGLYKLIIADVTMTAAGGSIGPFRYATLLNDTPTSPADPLAGFWDYGSLIAITDGEAIVFDFDGTNGVLSCQ